MKLELKQIAPYLAHGLKCEVIVNDGYSEYIPKIIIDNIIALSHECICFEKTPDWYFDSENESIIKPILLPLSALTEPLEDGSIPAIKLAELLIEKGIKKDIAPTIPFSAKIVTKPFGKMLKVTKCDEWYVMISFDSPERAQYILIEKLIEWNFDIYGLIDAGLAIDKRTIKL